MSGALLLAAIIVWPPFAIVLTLRFVDWLVRRRTDTEESQ